MTDFPPDRPPAAIPWWVKLFGIGAALLMLILVLHFAVMGSLGGDLTLHI